MKFISLGRHCDTICHIDKYVGSQATMLFDWSRTDFQCIIDILNTNNIHSIFNIIDVLLDDKMYDFDNEMTIQFKYFVDKNLTLLFHHDLKIDVYNNADDFEKHNLLLKFIDKLIRRYNRLCDLIRSQDKIVFVYKITTEYDFETNIKLFENVILNMNPNADFHLILLEMLDENWLYVKYPRCMRFNLSHYINKNITYYDWQNQHYKLFEIFDIVSKNLNTTSET